MPRSHLHITIDEELFQEINRLKGMVKRSTFAEYLLELGLDEYHKLHSQKIDVAKEA
jgi:metal-responsive CopG/Arc/MetJ family transcriptional regulator